MNRKVAKNDVSLALFVIVVCVAVLVESWPLPPGTFEPLGSGPVPQATAFIIIGLCVIILIRAMLRLRRLEAETKTAEEAALAAEEAASGFYPRPYSAAMVLVLACVYIGILYLGIVGFGLVTTLFLLATILFLIGAAPLRALAAYAATRDPALLAEAKPVLIALVIAVVMGFGCEVVFTKIFYVDLPTG